VPRLILKTRVNPIIECLDYQLPVTQLTNFKLNVHSSRGEVTSMFTFYPLTFIFWLWLYWRCFCSLLIK